MHYQDIFQTLWKYLKLIEMEDAVDQIDSDIAA